MFVNLCSFRRRRIYIKNNQELPSSRHHTKPI